jgi:predicted XRE-type DNA-binding protein
MSKQVIIEVPEHAVKMFGGDAAQFSRKMYETAVVKWFDEGILSQGQASELLGITRGEFFDLLYEHKVSPIQMTPEELVEECRRG